MPKPEKPPKPDKLKVKIKAEGSRALTILKKLGQSKNDAFYGQ